ncbi:response regulator [Carboxylicivirga sp. N1Y90]|uniref:response regulator n=1 Tax=Carboxylicivirga fragile TaxID=3417571 RepID=UPI003D3501B1|nr:response regulator [Marinilabiliaceae bacterium N1Y90]
MDLKTHLIKKLHLDEKVFPLTFSIVKNEIYLGTGDGLFVLNNNDRFIKIHAEITGDNNVFAISVDKRQNMFIGTRKGILKQHDDKFIDVSELVTDKYNLLPKRIFCLHYDAVEDCLWAGTIAEGLIKINLNRDGDIEEVTEYHTSFNNEKYIHNNSIWCIYQDDNQDLWLGTDLGLLHMKKNSETFEWVEVKGIADKKIMGIRKDHLGQLWLNNSQGIICFNLATRGITQFSYIDGLRTNTFTEAIDIDADGTIYFGSIDGISTINPKDIKSSKVESLFLITDFRVHNKSVEPGKAYGDRVILNRSINAVDTILIDHKHNNFLFEFSGSNFTKNYYNEFRYKLVGYDNRWIKTNENHRFASYSNLKAGTYSFLAHIANSQGVWNQAPRQIIVKVLPPPWLSSQAYILYFLIITGLVTGLLYFLYYRQKMKHQLVMDQIQIKQQESLNEMKLTFFTDVAHEFKTPLSLIYGPVNELINGDIIEDKKQLCLDVISRNTRRMMFLVSQLLDFRKIENEINILRVGKGDFSEFIKNSMQAFIWQAKNNQIAFSLNVPIEIICYFDQDVMEKVLFNIVSNAFKYTPKHGHIDVKITANKVDNPTELIISVRDSGKGIPDNEKKKIFERFFHGKDRFSSGIGLHLSYSLIMAHKGSIVVNDSKYGGAEFVIQLPVQKDVFDRNELVESVDGDVNIPINQSNVILPTDSDDKQNDVDNILVVEDDNELRAYLRSSLQDKYRVTEASNGKEGVDMALSILPDIIITDIMMPEMDGVEMCQILRKNNKTSHIPILMLTAKTDEQSQKIGLRAGAWDYINKPFDTTALLQKIRNIINIRQAYRKQLLMQDIAIEAQVHYTSYDQKFIAKAKKVVEDNIDNTEFNPDSFALVVGLSRMQLHRKLKALSGQSITTFVNSIKVGHASQMFDQGCDRIQEAMDAVGVNSHAHFNSMFKKVKGMTVAEYILKSKKKTKL